MALARQFGREASIYMSGFIGVGIIQFIALPIYSRSLGPEQYGLFSLTTATSTVLAGVMIVGGDVALARFWADTRTQREQRQLSSTWILFLTAWSIAIACCAVLAAPFLADAMRPGTDFTALLLVGFAGLVPTQLSRMLAQVLRNSFRPLAYSAVLVVNAGLDVAFALLFGVMLDYGVFGILLGILVGETLGALIRLPLVRQYLGRDFDWSLLPPLLKFGVPFIPASLAAWAMKGADRLVLGTTVSATELGYYGLAVSLVAPFAMVTTALGQAWIPRIAQIDVEDRAAAGRATSAAIGWSLAGFGSASMVVGALAPLIVAIVGGSAYAESATVLPFLALGAALAGLGLFTGTGLTLAKATRVIPLVAIITAVLDLTLLIALVPRLGLTGAAASVAVAYLVLALLTLRFANRVYPITVHRPALSVMLLALIGQALVCTARPNGVAVWAATAAAIAALAAAAWFGSRPRRRMEDDRTRAQDAP